jgi:uncharacterized protein with ATP-grasp and redox domains
MRTFLDCYPCFLNQALRAGRLSTDNEAQIKRLLDEVGDMLKTIPIESSPAETGQLIYRKVSEITANPDPYRQIKERNIHKALGLYPGLKKIVAQSDDPLLTALRIAIAGNVIDLGAPGEFDIEKEIEDVLEKPFAIGDYKAFKDHLQRAGSVLYLADNAAECVFDRILIEEMKKPVTFVVRDRPVINDATREDAIKAGLGDLTTVVSSGTDAPGTVLETCSREFKALFDRSEFIISKGQGNYEALSGQRHSIFFMLKVKCSVVAADLGVAVGDIILKDINA